nr:unnamed protein product [Callosobruchus chinensis]
MANWRKWFLCLLSIARIFFIKETCGMTSTDLGEEIPPPLLSGITDPRLWTSRFSTEANLNGLIHKFDKPPNIFNIADHMNSFVRRHRSGVV